LPRRHTSSAAGALAAALLAAASVPAIAQDATGQTTGPALRGSIAPQEEADSPALSVAKQRAQKAKRRPTSDGLDGASDGEGQGSQRPRTSGGLDDNSSLEPTTPAVDDLSQDPSLLPTPPSPPLGGLGDEPEEPAVPELGITTETGETGLEPPGTEDVTDERPLAPERHDLDPYVPIGMKLGSFLLFTEAEVGTILTDNVLGTRIDPQSDIAFEFAPNVRLESNWSRHFFSAEFDADRSWYNDFSVEDDRTYLALLKGRLDVTRRTHAQLELGKSQTQEGRNSINLTDIAGAQTNVQEQHITGGADHTFNRLTLEFTGTSADYDYSDFAGPFFVVDPTVPTGVPTQDIRDYREDE
jgi:hypothetical protein